MNRKKKPTSATRGMTAAWLLCLALFLTELFFYTWCRVQCTQTGYGITRADESRRELLTLQSNLKIELERLKSPERIARIAGQRLGLVPPTPEQMVTIQ